MPIIRIVLVTLVLLGSASGWATTRVELFTPYDFAPFVMDRAAQKGLIYDFQRELNRRGRGRYEFRLETVPRVPTERLLKMTQSAIVPFVAKDWFDDTDAAKFDWTRSQMEDANVIVSHRSKPLDSLESGKIRGKVVVITSGLRRDPDVEKLILDSVVSVHTATDFSLCLLMVARKRADFFVAGHFMVNYLIKQQHLEDQLYVSPKPLRVIERKTLVSPKGHPALLDWLNEQILDMEKSPDWQKLMAQFNANLAR
ncbi:MAG TPA: transporter substrate-binding domain-containing protein [Oligoflexus sp.]|uniref:substrate-binding periplasmic protein n=1 Tax=Oligoflexus sp. TaxID=1971216 RepID=UPI002D598462|nr:transporter substrate-binding domain-containing protein [Oligoflexus sp.]HYX32940.1 transporter substrate-binding domain-containing protein [Oligoflexus sp.]